MKTLLFCFVVVLASSSSLLQADATKSCIFRLADLGEAANSPLLDQITSRSLTNLTLAKELFEDGKIALVKRYLYDGQFPSLTLLKNDLEFISNNWDKTSLDLPDSEYIFVLRTKQTILSEGASLAQNMGDRGAAKWYRQQAEEISKHLHILEVFGSSSH